MGDAALLGALHADRGRLVYLRTYFGTPNVTSIRAAFSVHVENAGASGSTISLMRITLPSPHIVHIKLASDGTLVFRDSSGVDGGAASEQQLPGSSALGIWRRVEVDIDVLAKTASVLFDGTQVLTPALLGLGAPTTVDNFYLGFDFPTGPGPWDVHIDDVIFDAK